MEYFYHMLASEFGYSRWYVDNYINMPSLRALMKYREDNPPVGMLLKVIFGSDETKDTQKTKEDKVTLASTFAATKTTDNSLKKFVNIIDKPVNY